MSAIHTAAALQVTRLDCAAKCTLLVLAMSADSHGRGDLQPRQLALLTGLSERSIRTQRAFLTREGYIEAAPYETKYQLAELG